MRDEWIDAHGPVGCAVCHASVDDCDCPECPKCHAQGDPDCINDGHMQPATDSIASFLDHIGVEPLDAALRAIDRHNLEHVWIETHTETVYYHTHRASPLPLYTRLARVGVGAIRWDGSDAEFTEVVAAGDWAALDQARDDANDWADETESID